MLDNDWELNVLKIFILKKLRKLLCKSYRKDFSFSSVDRIILAHNLNLSHFGNMLITIVDFSR